MNFRSIAQLSDQLLRWSRELPRDIEVVAGIPRSGLLAANILALYLNVPLTDVDGLLRGTCYPSGARRRQRKPQPDAGSGLAPDVDFLASPRRVLVLDDSVLGGRAMAKARDRVASGNLPHEITYGAVYVSPRRRHVVDVACELLNPPRVFEWNLFHIGLLEEFCVDLEGVLLPSPARAPGTADFGTALASATPLVSPSREIGWLVTSRAEADRHLILEWLERHDIRCRNLVAIGDGGPAGTAARADLYRDVEARLYISDSLSGAVQLARMADRQVLCTRTMQLVEPGAVPLPRSDPGLDLHPQGWADLADSIGSAARAAARRLLPASAQRAIRRR